MYYVVVQWKQAARDRNVRIATVCSVGAVFHIEKTGVLGTFKFITKYVVCIIIADFLKNLGFPL